MEPAREIAALVGPILMVLAASEGLNFRIWHKVSPTVVYLNGLLLFTGGLALLRAHGKWAWHWTLLLTLTGWIALLGGLFRVFAPNAKQLPPGPATYAPLVLIFLVGGTLTYMAYLT